MLCDGGVPRGVSPVCALQQSTLMNLCIYCIQKESASCCSNTGSSQYQTKHALAHLLIKIEINRGNTKRERLVLRNNTLTPCNQGWILGVGVRGVIPPKLKKTLKNFIQNLLIFFFFFGRLSYFAPLGFIVILPYRVSPALNQCSRSIPAYNFQ